MSGQRVSRCCAAGILRSIPLGEDRAHALSAGDPGVRTRVHERRASRPRDDQSHHRRGAEPQRDSRDGGVPHRPHRRPHDELAADARGRAMDAGAVPRVRPHERARRRLRVRPRLVHRAHRGAHGHAARAGDERDSRRVDAADAGHPSRRGHRRADAARARLRQVARPAPRQDRARHRPERRLGARPSAVPPPLRRGLGQARQLRAADALGIGHRARPAACHVRRQARCVSRRGRRGRVAAAIVSRRRLVARRRLSASHGANAAVAGHRARGRGLSPPRAAREDRRRADRRAHERRALPRRRPERLQHHRGDSGPRRARGLRDGRRALG